MPWNEHELSTLNNKWKKEEADRHKCILSECATCYRSECVYWSNETGRCKLK